MSVNAIGSNPVIIESIKTISEQGNVRKNGNLNILNDPQTPAKSINQDQKNSIVSEKLDHRLSNSDIYLRYHINVPVAKAENSVKTYNETERIKSDAEEDEFCEFSYITDNGEIQNSTIGGGSFISIFNQDYAERPKNLKSQFDIFKEKLNKTYQVGFVKSPGTLVNLVF
ncbi:MAG: hypothetical protein NTX22_11385 [Ignavibacteriales bacterium]|nr:hypothetical protein [Ignavibacteriales bacterium]